MDFGACKLILMLFACCSGVVSVNILFGFLSVDSKKKKQPSFREIFNSPFF